MAVSGSKDFEPDVAIYVEEAFERCGLELRTGYDLKTATRSLNLMLAEWANRGLNQWTVAEKTVAMVKDTATYNIDTSNATAPIDVLDAFVRETVNSVETDVPLSRMSRSEYSHISQRHDRKTKSSFCQQAVDTHNYCLPCARSVEQVHSCNECAYTHGRRRRSN